MIFGLYEVAWDAIVHCCQIGHLFIVGFCVWDTSAIFIFKVYLVDLGFYLWKNDFLATWTGMWIMSMLLLFLFGVSFVPVLDVPLMEGVEELFVVCWENWWNVVHYFLYEVMIWVVREEVFTS